MSLALKIKNAQILNVTHILTFTMLASLQISYITAASNFLTNCICLPTSYIIMWELMSAISILFKLTLYTLEMLNNSSKCNKKIPKGVSWNGFIARLLSQLAVLTLPCNGLRTLHKYRSCFLCERLVTKTTFQKKNDFIFVNFWCISVQRHPKCGLNNNFSRITLKHQNQFIVIIQVIID